MGFGHLAKMVTRIKRLWKRKERSPDGAELDPKEMSFLEHLEELRGVLLKSLAAFTAGLALVVVGIHQLADLLVWPLNQAYEMVGKTQENLITTRVFEIFNVLILVCFLGGFVAALPFMLYFGATFVAPGLTQKELSILRPGCVAAFALFMLGAAFAFFLVLPPAIAITLTLNQTFGIEQMLTVGSYYNTVVWVTFGVGLAFEFPLVLILLVTIDIVTVAQLRANWRMAVVLVLVASALITPGGDPVTLLLLAGPLYGLYEGALVVAARIKKEKPAGAEDGTAGAA